MIRHLSKTEKKVLCTIARSLDIDEQAQLLNDIEKCFIINEENSKFLIQFGIAGYERPVYKGQHTYGVEGKVKDKDGATLTVLLFADENNRLLELELIRWSEKDEAIIEPQWESLIISK